MERKDFEIVKNAYLKRMFLYLFFDQCAEKQFKEFFEQENIIVQYCQFHQLKTIRNYISNKPRLKSSKFLKEMLYNFTDANEENFKKEFKFFLEIFKDEINRKELDLETQKYYFIHRKLRSAIRSLINNLPYLFNYLKYPKLNIPNTTKTFLMEVSFHI
jgi:hypothetical protein